MRLAIATTTFAPVGGFWGVTWSLPKAATVAKELGADGIGAYPLRGAVTYRGREDLAVPVLFVGGHFNPDESGLLDRIMFPDPDICEGFVLLMAARFGVPIETHSPAEAARLVLLGLRAWMETIPEKGYSLEDHIQEAEEGGFGLSIDNWDLQGRHDLVEPFGDSVRAMVVFLESGLVRNIHAQPTHKEVSLILQGRGRETTIAALLHIAKRWGYEGLVTLEVNPFTVWRYDPLAILPGRYLRRLGQITKWVRAQAT